MRVLLQLVCLLAVFVRCRTESLPDVLREATVPVYDQTLCRESYATEDLTVTGKMLCAGYSQGGIDSCQGDSGGPLVALSDKNDEQYYLIGIVDFGKGCALKGFPGVYTRVTQYEKWINETISGFPDGATCGRRQAGLQSLVIGGNPAEEHAWPWMVAIEGEFVCGGSLIDPLWVITAAHCVNGNISILEFGMGSSSLAKIPTRRRASEVHINPGWIDKCVDDPDDIALVKLSEPVVITNDTLATVCLPTKDMDNQFGVGHSATVTGWGETQTESPSRTSRTSPTCPTSPTIPTSRTSPTNPTSRTSPTNPTSRLRRQDKIAIICLAVISGILLTTIITGIVWYLRCERKGPGLLDTQRSSPSYMTSYNMSEVFPTTDDTEEIIDRVGSRKC